MREEREFPRQMDALEDVLATTDAFLERIPADEQTAFAARLAVEELFTNAVRHGVGGADHVTITLALEKRTLTITVTDFDVEPWDPGNLPEVDTHRPLRERTPGGLGIHILRRLFDDMDWSYTDRTLRITVSKELEPSDVRSAST
mgnify:CR=1 FL=1